MATGRAIVIGSGAGGSTAAMILAEAGWNVLILEKGTNYFGDLTQATPSTVYSNDELKGRRRFEDPDPAAFPRTFRHSAADTEPLYVGDVNMLPETVGGGTAHWDAKVPRYWDIDFQKRSMLGPVDGADVQDWPFDYTEIAPWYDEVEALLGVQGDVTLLPKVTNQHAPRSKQLPMPPGPGQYSSLVAAAGCEKMGFSPYPMPAAINSQIFDDRPACNNCGACSHYGCPIHARVGALAPLRRALLAGAELRANSFVYKVNFSGAKATGVTYVNQPGTPISENADLIVLAASAIETVRLALLSGFPDPSGYLGRCLMFHWFTDGVAIFFDRRLHPYRGRTYTHGLDDFADPDFPGARAAAHAAGLPYIRGGVVEMGGSQDVIAEALTYQEMMPFLSRRKPFGHRFKRLMRASLLRDRLLGLELIGEDLAQVTNRVDLDPKVKDIYGVPVARVTYAPHQHELVAQQFFIPVLTKLAQACGGQLFGAVPENSTDATLGVSLVPSTAHIMGGMRMGFDPASSVCDPYGRVHAFDNVFITDASVFVTAGGHNPTNTLMAVAMRSARYFAG